MRLLIIITGDRNVLLGRKLPHRYNVLAYFRITDVWFERIGTKSGAKVRFEKLDLASKSWWAAKDSRPPLPLEQRDFDTKPAKMQCPVCLELSTQIYSEGWMCLQPACENFWIIDTSNSPPGSLTFDPVFLGSRAAPDPSLQPHCSLVPNLLATINEHEEDASLSRIAWKGIVCPRCSKCISRRFWRGWKCTDDIAIKPGQDCNVCLFEKMMNIKPVSLRSVVDDFELGPIKQTLFFDPKFAVPEIDDQSLYPYRKLSYPIMGAGSITQFVSNKAINGRENGPNDLFRRLQFADIGLRRYPLQQSVGKSIRICHRRYNIGLTFHPTVAGTLTAHFAVNYVSCRYL